MEKEAFQKRLEDLGELAKINQNRLSTDAVKTFLKDMDLTEEQYNLVFAYLASKLITVEGYVPAAGVGKEGAPELTEEEKKEQQLLRKEFLASVRMNLKSQLDNIDILNKDGSVENLGEKYGQKLKEKGN